MLQEPDKAWGGGGGIQVVKPSHPKFEKLNLIYQLSIVMDVGTKVFA